MDCLDLCVYTYILSTFIVEISHAILVLIWLETYVQMYVYYLIGYMDVHILVYVVLEAENTCICVTVAEF